MIFDAIRLFVNDCLLLGKNISGIIEVFFPEKLI